MRIKEVEKIVQEDVLESSNVEAYTELDLTFSTRLIDRFSKKKVLRILTLRHCDCFDCA